MRGDGIDIHNVYNMAKPVLGGKRNKIIFSKMSASEKRTVNIFMRP